MLLVLTSLLALVYLPYWTLALMPEYSFFTLHPVCMVLLYCSSAIGIQQFSRLRKRLIAKKSAVNAKSTTTSSTLLPTASRLNTINNHATLQFITLLLTLLAFTAIEYGKFVNNRAHFISWHGTLGVTTVFGVVSVFLAGSLNHNVPNVIQKALSPLGITTTSFWKVHRLLGWVVFSLLGWVLYLGLFTGFMDVCLNHNSQLDFEVMAGVGKAKDLFRSAGVFLIAGIWVCVTWSVFVRGRSK